MPHRHKSGPAILVPEKALEENEADLVAVPVEAIPVNLPLPCSVYVKIAGRFPLFRKQGEKLTSKRTISLAEKGAAFLYIHKAVWRVFITTLEKTSLKPDAEPQEIATQLRGLILTYGIELEKKIRAPKRPLFEKLRSLSEALAEAIRLDPSVGTDLLRRSRDSQAYFVNHAVNSSIYSTVIGVKMNFSLSELKILTYAALVHDFGNLYLPKSILFKKSDLTSEEQAEMRTHCRKGAELLQQMGCPPPVVLTALQHHERMDGEGYPSRLKPADIHPFSRIVALADTYDALTSNRTYQAAMTPADAIATMKKLTGKFDPKILGTITWEKVAELGDVLPVRPHKTSLG